MRPIPRIRTFYQLFAILTKMRYYSETIFVIWPYRLMVRTEAFQALNRGSTPRRVTNWFLSGTNAEERLKAYDNLGVPLTISA